MNTNPISKKTKKVNKDINIAKQKKVKSQQESKYSLQTLPTTKHSLLSSKRDLLLNSTSTLNKTQNELKNEEKEEENAQILTWVNELQIPLTDDLTPEELIKYGLISSQQFDFQKQTYTVRETLKNEIQVRKSDKFGDRWLDTQEKNTLLYSLKEQCMLKKQNSVNQEFKEHNYSNISYGMDKEYEEKDEELEGLETKLTAIEELLQVADKNSSSKPQISTLLDQVYLFLEVAKSLYKAIDGDQDKWEAYMDEYVIDFLEEQDEEFYELFAEFLYDYDDLIEFLEYIEHDYDFELEYEDPNYEFEIVIQKLQKETALLKSDKVQAELDEVEHIKEQIREKKIELKKLKNNLATEQEGEINQEEMDKMKDLVEQQRKKAEEAFQNITDSGDQERREQKYLDMIKNKDYDVQQELEYLVKGEENIIETTERILADDKQISENSIQQAKIQDIQQFSLEQQNTSTELLLNHAEKAYLEELKGKIQKQEEKIQQIIDDLNSDSTNQDKWNRIYEDEILRVLNHQLEAWLPLMKKRETQKTYKNRNVQQDLNSQYINLGREINLLKKSKEGAVGLLENPVNGYLVTQERTLLKYEQGQIVQVVTNLDNKEGVLGTISAQLQEELDKYKVKIVGIDDNLLLKREELPKIEADLNKINENIENQKEDLTYESLKYLKMKQDSEQYYEIQAGSLIEQVDQKMLRTVPKVVDYIGEERATNMIKAQVNDQQKVSDFSAYEALINEICEKFLLVLCLQEISLDFSEISSNIVKLTTYNGTYTMKIEEEKLEKIKAISADILAQDTQKIETAFYDAYTEMGIDSKSIKNSEEISNLLQKRKPQRTLEKYVSIRNIVMELPILGLKNAHYLENSTDFLIQIDPEHKEEPAQVIVRKTDLNQNLLYSSSEYIVEDIYNFLKQNEAKLSITGQQILNNIDQDEAQKFFEEWILDLSDSEKLLDLDDILFNSESNSSKHLCNLFTLYFSKTLLEKKHETFENITEKTKKTKEKQQLESEIKLLSQQKHQTDKQIQIIEALLPIANNPPQETDKKVVFGKICENLAKFQQEQAENLTKISNEIRENQDIIKEKQKIQSEYVFKIKESDYETVIFPQIVDFHFIYNFVILSDEKWENIPGSNDQNQMLLLQEARELVRIMGTQVNNGELDIDEDLKKFQIDELGRQLTAKVGENGGYLVGNILRKVCVDIKDEFKKKRSQEKQGLDNEIISLLNKGQFMESVKDTIQLVEGSLGNKVLIVEDYLRFLEDPTDPGNLEEYKELKKYQQQLFETSVKFQLQELQDLLQFLDEKYLCQIENNANSDKIYIGFGEFFKKDYFSTLDLSKPSEILKNINAELLKESEKEIPQQEDESQLFSKIQAEINKNYNSTIWLQSLLRRLEISLKQIPEIVHLEQILEQDSLNLYKVYTVLLNEERIEKHKELQIQINELENTIKALENSLKDSYLKDWDSIKFEKECADAIIFYIDNYRDMDYLWQRIKDTEDSETQVNLYQFTIDGETYIVQLFKEGVEEQNQEKEEIQRIKKLIEENNSTISKKKGQKEIYSLRVEDIREDKFPELLKIVNQELFTQSLVMTGFEEFSNGETLLEVDSFIATLIDRIIEENSLFWYKGRNQTTPDLQGRVKKIRVILGDNFKLFDSKQEKFEKQYLQILQAINNEYKSDNLAIKSLRIKQKGLEKLVEIEDDDVTNGSSLLLAKVQGRFYSLISVEDWTKASDDVLQMNIMEKFDYIQTMIEGDSRLFQQVCRYRLSDILGQSYTQAENFVQGYKTEVYHVENTNTLEKFLSYSTEILAANDVLYTYLCLYTSIFKEIQASNTLFSQYKEIYEGTKDPLQLLKKEYKDSLMDVAVAEQMRRKKIMENLQDSTDKEQRYWQDMLEEALKSQEELEDLLQEKEDEINETEGLLQDQLEQIKKQQEEYEQMLADLEKIKDELKADLQASKDRLEELQQQEDQNKEEIEKTEEEIAKKEAELEEKEKELEEYKEKEAELNEQIQEISDKIDRLELDKEKKEAEKEQLNQDLEAKKQDIQASQTVLKIQDNLERMLKIYEYYQQREKVQEFIGLSESLAEMVNKGKKPEYQDIWAQLIQGVPEEDYNVFLKYIELKKDFLGLDIYQTQSFLGENCHYLLKINIEPRQDSLIDDLRIFKTRVPIVSLQALYSEVKKVVELEMKKAQSGLFFNENDQLFCDSIDKIENLPENLKKLVERRIELHYLNKSYEEDPRKTAKGEEAKTIINELKIPYKEVLRCFVDELFIVSDRFYLDSQEVHFPGIDFSLNCTKFEVIGTQALINVSGLEGEQFLNKYAASGESIRKAKDPQGGKGADGYDGMDGMNSGNVVMKIEQEIINQEGLLIYANGGDGGEGQYGGDGDEGLKGERGVPGTAPNTSGMGGKQICIGFGTIGKVGGDGGAPGKTGRPGRGGYSGSTYVQLREYEITQNLSILSNNGTEGDDILSEDYPDEKPLQGEPGLGGLPGFDQLKTKQSFFHSTETNSKIYIDTGKLKLYCLENGHKDQIPKVEKRENIKMTNNNFLAGFIGATVGTIILGGTLAVLFGPAGVAASVTIAGVGWAALGTATIGIAAGFIAGAFGSMLETEEMEELDVMRNNSKEENDVKKETEERQDKREEQEQKRQERNVESMHQEYLALQKEKAEVFQEEIFRQYMAELESDKQAIDQEIKETEALIELINAELAELGSEKLTKEMELEIIQGMITRLTQEIDAIQEELNELEEHLQDLTEEGKKIREQKLQEMQHLQNIVNQLNLATEQGMDYNDIKKELDIVVDQYIKMLEEKLASQNEEMDQLREELEQQILASQEFKNKIQDMENASEINQIIQEEIEKIQEELEGEIDFDDIIIVDDDEPLEVVIPYDEGKISPPVELPYVVKKADYYENLELKFDEDSKKELQEVLRQSLRDFRGKRVNLSILTQKIIDVLKAESEEREEMVVVYESYCQKVEEIQLKQELELLPEAEKMLFTQTMTRIYNVLYQDSFQIIDQEYQPEFLFSILDQENLKDFDTIKALKQKILDRKYDIYYRTNDGIVKDLARILSILRSSRWFYLEDCYPNEVEIEKFSEFEKSVISFNKSSGLSLLLSLIEEYEKLLPEQKTTTFDQNAFNNLKSLSISMVHVIREHLTSKREDKSDLEEYIQNFQNCCKIMIKTTILEDLKLKFQEILDILEKYSALCQQALDLSEKKKLANSLLKQLKQIASKLLLFHPDDKFQQLNDSFLDEKFKLTENHTENELLLEDFLHQIEDTKDRILYQNEEPIPDDPSELPEPEKDPFKVFLELWNPLILDKYSKVLTVQKAEINAFLIDIYQTENLNQKTEQEIEKIMNSRMEDAYYTSQISIIRNVQEEDLKEVGSILGYDLETFKALIKINTFNADLCTKIREKEAEIVKHFDDKIEQEEDQEHYLSNPFSLVLDLEYKMLVYQQSLEDIDLGSFELKFHTRFYKLGDKVDMDMIGELLQNQALSSIDEKLTVEERIFQRLDELQPYILVQTLLELEDQVVIQSILKRNVGQNVLTVETVEKDQELYAKFLQLIGDNGSMDSLCQVIGDEYKEKSEQKDLDLPIYYLEQEYEVALTILENGMFSTEEIETKINNSSVKPVVFMVLKSEYKERNDLQMEQISKSLFSLTLTINNNNNNNDNNNYNSEEEKKEVLKKLGKIQTDIKNISKGREVFQVQPGSFHSLSLYKKFNTSIKEFKQEIDKIEVFFQEEKDKETEFQLKQIFQAYDIAFQIDDKKALFDTLIKIFQDIALSQMELPENDLSKLIYELSQLIDSLKSENQAHLTENLYNLVDFITQNSQKNQTNKDHLQTTLQFLLKKADMLSLNTVHSTFESLQNKESEQISKLEQLKSEIKKNFQEETKVIIDKQKRENYSVFFSLHLEKLELLFAPNGTDLACEERIDQFKDFQNDIQDISIDEQKKEVKYLEIENELGDLLEDLALKDLVQEKEFFSLQMIENKLENLQEIKLKVLIIDHDVDESASSLVKDGLGIQIDDLFDKFGQLDAARAGFDADLKKIIIYKDEITRDYIFYRYPRDSFSDPETVSGLISDLTQIYDKYMLIKFKDNVENWNDKDRLSKLYAKYLLEGIQYFLIRVESDENVDNLQLVSDFCEGLGRAISNIIFNEDRDEEILSNLRVSVDYFIEYVLANKLYSPSENEGEEEEDNDDQKEILKKINQILFDFCVKIVQKSYKELNLGNVVEEEQEFQEAQKKITLQGELQIIWSKLLKLVMHRAELGINDKGSFYVSLVGVLSDNNFYVSAADFDRITKKNIDNINEFIDSYSNSIIVKNLDENSDNLDEFIKKINENQLQFSDILKEGEERKQSVRNLKLILLDNKQQQEEEQEEENSDQKLDNEKVKELILLLNNEEDSEFVLIQGLLTLYSQNSVDNLKEKYQDQLPSDIDIEVYTQQIFGKLFSAFEYQEQNSDQQSLKLILNNIDLTIAKISEILDENQENPYEDLDKTLKETAEKIEIDFITSILEIQSKNMSQEVINAYKLLSETTEKTRFSALLGLLPLTFFENGSKQDFKALLQLLIADFKSQYQQQDDDDQISSENQDFYSKIQILIYHYSKINLPDFIPKEEEKEDEDTHKWKVEDNTEALMILSYNILPLQFLLFTEQKMLDKQTLQDEQKKGYNYVITNDQIYTQNTESLTSILPFISDLEAENLKKALKLKEDEDLKAAIENLEKDPKQADLLEKITFVFQQPVISWFGQLTELRFVIAKDSILDQATFGRSRDGNSDSFGDCVKLLQFLSSQKSNQEQALYVLELIEQNLPKFNKNVNEIKRCVNEIAYLDDYQEISDIIQGNQQHVTFDILFNRLGVKENEELKNSMTRLKIAMQREKFVDVEYFCVVFVMKISGLDSDEGVAEVIDYVIDSQLYVKESLLSKIKEKEFLSWKQDLQKEIIRSKVEITVFRYQRYTQKEKMVELLYQIQIEKGVSFYEYLFNEILRKMDNIKMQRVLGQLNKILHEDVKITDLEKLKEEDDKIKDIMLWNDILYPKQDNIVDGEDLSVEELLDLMKEGDKSTEDGFNYSRKDIIMQCTTELDIVPLLEAALDMSQTVTQFDELNEELKGKPVNDWKKEDLTHWSAVYFDKQEYKNIDLYNIYHDSFKKELLIETFRVINKGVHLFKGYYPRNNILMAIIFFLANREGKVGSLGNIATGEGKSTLTIFLAIIHALCGLKIDVLTSSKVLAIRDSQPYNAETGEGWRDLYDWFGVQCNNNCDEQAEDPRQGDTVKKTRYATCQVIYGEAGYFQRDILLTEFFGKGIRPGKSTADVIILDEVDNMMIDNAVKTLYISHRINDFRYLKDVFIRIWLAVNGPDGSYTKESIEVIETKIRQITRVYDEIMVLFDTLKATLDKISESFPIVFCGKQKQIVSFLQGESIVQLKDGSEIQLVDNTEFIRQHIIEALEQIASKSASYNKENFTLLLEKLELKKTELQQFDEDLIFIPKTLLQFVNSNIKPWIENAFYAKFIDVDDSYIIGDNESAGPGLAIIMDKDTGVEQNSTKWSRGLHQFVQLKHNLKLSDESLKAVYLSNLNYFQKYNKLYGMSGTVGDKDERSLIGTSYNTDFFEVPRFKKYRFKYDADVESVAATQEEWLQNIVENVDENVDQQIEYSEQYKADIKVNIEKYKKEKTENENELAVKIQESSKYEEKLTAVNLAIEKLVEIENLCFEIIAIGNIMLNYEQKVEQIQNKIAQLDQIFTEVPEELKDLVAQLKPILDPFNSVVNEFDLDKKIARFASDLSSLQLSTRKNEKLEEKDSLDQQIKDLSIGINYLTDELNTIIKEIETYEQELENAEQDKKDPHRRPILIICENIASVDTIHKKISKEFPTLNIFIYDRAYRKFDKMKLDQGDIVIATNIAGRGTSFKVTEKAEMNGGLHVIISFMSQNIRVEKQAFGRTARGGKKGTGTFIVLDGRGEDFSIPELKMERNEKEQLRLQNVKEKQFPKIEKEDQLFKKFNELKQSVLALLQKNKKSINRTEQYIELQIDSLKNKFAVWLSELEDELLQVYESEENSQEIDIKFQQFKQQICSQVDSTHPFQLIEEPGELNRLGRYYYDRQKYKDAITCFDEVIEYHPEFQEIAQYYRSFAIIKKDGGHLSSKVQAKNALKKSLPILERQRDNTIMRNQIIDIVNDLRASKGEYAGLRLFHESNDRVAELTQVQISSILSQIGMSETTADSFKSAVGAAGDMDERFFREFRKDEYGLVKNKRISKKVVIACETVYSASEKEKVKEILQNKLNDSQNNEEIKEICQKLLGNLAVLTENTYLTYVILKEKLNISDFSYYRKVIDLLFQEEIVRKMELYKNKTTKDLNKIKKTTELIDFPNTLYQEQQNLLLKMDYNLQQSADQGYFHLKRQINEEFFFEFIYTKDQYLKDSEGLVQQKDSVKLNPHLERVMLGKPDHEVYKGKGEKLKEILKEKINVIEKQKIAIEFEILSIKTEIMELDINDDQYTEKLETLTNKQEAYEEKLLTLYTLDAATFQQELMDQLELSKEEVLAILDHLENYEYINPDLKLIEKDINEAKNQDIFFQEKAQITEFCTGKLEITLKKHNNNKIKLEDNLPYSISDIHSALKQIIVESIVEKNITDANDDEERENLTQETYDLLAEDAIGKEKSDFEALLIVLGFKSGSKEQVLVNTKELILLEKEENLKKIEEYLAIINLKSFGEKQIQLLQEADFTSFSEDLGKKQDQIKEIIFANAGNQLKIDNFVNKDDQKFLNQEEFSVLRDALVDLEVINSGILNHLRGNEEEVSQTIIDQEVITKTLHQYGGTLDEKHLLLKDAESGSNEIIERFMVLDIIKPVRMNFPLHKQPNKFEIEYLKQQASSSEIPTLPEKNINPDTRLKHIKKMLDTILDKVYKKEQENSDKSAEIDKIMDSIKEIVGTIKQFQKIRVIEEDIEEKFPEGGIPPEYLDLVEIGFEKLFKFVEDKGFNWDAFLVAMLGVLQIVAGCAIMYLSGGSLTIVAKGFISEGISDISYAVSSAIAGNFSWKTYGHFKLIGVCTTFLSSGLTAALPALGGSAKIKGMALATKSMIAKTIAKQVFMETLQGVANGLITYSVNELSSMIFDLLINEFREVFDNYIENSMYNNDIYRQSEQIMHELYDRYGMDSEDYINNEYDKVIEEIGTTTLEAQITSSIAGIVDSVGTQLRRQASDLMKKGKLGKLAGIGLYSFTAAAYGYEQANGIKKLCTLCSQINNKFLDRLQQLQARLEDEIVMDEEYIEKVEREKAKYDFNEEVKNLHAKINTGVEEQFKAIVLKSFMKPAIKFPLNKTLTYLRTQFEAKVMNPKAKLEEQINTKADNIGKQIMSQTENRIYIPSKKILKSMEELGKLQDLPNLKKQLGDDEYDSIVQDKNLVQNFPGSSLKQLQDQHGKGLKVYIKDEKYYAVLPSYEQYTKNLYNRQVPTSTLTINVASEFVQGRINLHQVTKFDANGNPIISKKYQTFGSDLDDEPYKIALIHPKDGSKSYYAPVIKDPIKGQVVVKISTGQDSFVQSVIYLKHYKKTGNKDSAYYVSKDDAVIGHYYRSMSMTASSSQSLKNKYHLGQQGKPIKKIEDEDDLTQQQQRQIQNIVSTVDSRALVAMPSRVVAQNLYRNSVFQLIFNQQVFHNLARAVIDIKNVITTYITHRRNQINVDFSLRRPLSNISRVVDTKRLQGSSQTVFLNSVSNYYDQKADQLKAQLDNEVIEISVLNNDVMTINDYLRQDPGLLQIFMQEEKISMVEVPQVYTPIEATPLSIFGSKIKVLTTDQNSLINQQSDSDLGNETSSIFKEFVGMSDSYAENARYLMQDLEIEDYQNYQPYSVHALYGYVMYLKENNFVGREGEFSQDYEVSDDMKIIYFEKDDESTEDSDN